MAKHDEFIERIERCKSRICSVIKNLKEVVERLEPLAIRVFVLVALVVKLIHIVRGH